MNSEDAFLELNVCLEIIEFYAFQTLCNQQNTLFNEIICRLWTHWKYENRTPAMEPRPHLLLGSFSFFTCPSPLKAFHWTWSLWVPSWIVHRGANWSPEKQGLTQGRTLAGRKAEASERLSRDHWTHHIVILFITIVINDCVRNLKCANTTMKKGSLRMMGVLKFNNSQNSICVKIQETLGLLSSGSVHRLLFLWRQIWSCS